MDEDEYPATQPVLPSLLGDIVAYVEVRSGHDNRSRGVISELRSLGASIAPILNRDVTHVVFQGGRLSTYKKAKQQMCHVVAVSWIEASKELGYKAPEVEHPPPGFEKYEDPDAARKIRVLKSMQPDFDDEKDDERLNAKLERIKKRSAKRSASIESKLPNVNVKPGKKKKSSVSDKKNKSATELSRSLDRYLEKNVNGKKTRRSRKRAAPTASKAANTAGNVTSPKRIRRSSVAAKSGSGSADSPSLPSSSTNTNHTEDDKIKGTVDPKLSNNIEKNEIKSSAPETSPKSFEFAIPKLVKRVGKKAGSQASSGNNLLVQAGKCKPENEASRIADPKIKETHLPCSNDHDWKFRHWRPLGFIENIPREKDYSSKKGDVENEPPQHLTSARQTKRTTDVADLIQNKLNAGNKKCQPEMTGPNLIFSTVLKVLDTRKKPQIHLKSPWRRQSAPTERRQSPRFSALRKENNEFANGADSDGSPQFVKKEKAEPRKNVVLDSASAHMLKFWKAKPSGITSQEVRLLDISFSPVKISKSRNSVQSNINSDTSSVSIVNKVETNSSKQDTPVQNDQTSWKSLSETLNSELTDEDRSVSPILGTRVKHRLPKSFLSSTRVSTESLPGVTHLDGTLLPKMLADHQDSNCSVVTAAVAVNTLLPQTKERVERKDQNVSCSSSKSVVDCTKIEEEASTGGLDSSVRPSRRRSRPDENVKLPTLVCTHLKGSDVMRVMKAVRNLGKFEFEEQVSERTTHLVASGPRRTINMLRGIARGCWILRDEWVYQSVTAGRWLREDDFELTEFSPLVQERRLRRQSPSGLGHWDLLSSVGPIFVGPKSQPCPADLKDLILLSGGTVSKTADKAAVIIGLLTKTSKNKCAKPRVSPAWILDCLVKGEKLSFLSPEYTEKA